MLNKKENSDITSVIENTRSRGEAMGLVMPDILNRAGFPISLISQHGVVCIDIGDGPELIAFRQFSPRILIASEPVTYPNTYTADEPVKSLVLANLAQESGAIVLRCHEKDTFDYLRRINYRVGLVTKLNLLPGFLDSYFFISAMEILVPGGIALLSADDRRNYDELKTLAEEKLSHIKTKVFTREISSAGEVFLAAFKSY